MASNYVCTLNEASLKRAKKELNEDPKERMGAVETLRNWIEGEKHIRCATTDEFLIPFLRTAKFSQLRAREILEGYLALTTDLPHWYHNMDPLDPGIKEALKARVMIPLPGHDKHGRKVIIFRQGAITKDQLKRISTDKKFKDDFFKSFMIILRYALFDENTQVNGFVYVNDFSNYTMAHFTAWPRSDIKDMMRWQGNCPGRFKKFLYYNTPSIFDTVMEFVKPFLGKKFKERIQMLGSNMETVYKLIPMEMLPLEFLPDDYSGKSAGTMDNILDNVINDLQRPENRDRLVYESRPEWTIDNAQKDKAVPTASFRKLNID